MVRRKKYTIFSDNFHYLFGQYIIILLGCSYIFLPFNCHKIINEFLFYNKTLTLFDAFLILF